MKIRARFKEKGLPYTKFTEILFFIKNLFNIKKLGENILFNKITCILTYFMFKYFCKEYYKIYYFPPTHMSFEQPTFSGV